jgi:hypothetical protein
VSQKLRFGIVIGAVHQMDVDGIDRNDSWHALADFSEQGASFGARQD